MRSNIPSYGPGLNYFRLLHTNCLPLSSNPSHNTHAQLQLHTTRITPACMQTQHSANFFPTHMYMTSGSSRAAPHTKCGQVHRFVHQTSFNWSAQAAVPYAASHLNKLWQMQCPPTSNWRHLATLPCCVSVTLVVILSDLVPILEHPR
jgi:hypothetical protein